MLLWLILFKNFKDYSGVSIIDLEHVNADWIKLSFLFQSLVVNRSAQGICPPKNILDHYNNALLKVSLLSRLALHRNTVLVNIEKFLKNI